MKTLMKTIAALLIAIFHLCGLTGCLNTNKPLKSNATAPLTGEFVSAGGSRMTFANYGDKDWSTGEVLVNLADDAKYLLEGRANDTTYRYVFGMNNLPANYDVADDFQLSNGKEWFANCRSGYTSTGNLVLKPYLLSGDELIFRRINGKSGTYGLVPKDN